MPVCKSLCLKSTPFLPATSPLTADMFVHDDDDPTLSLWKALTTGRAQYQNPVTWNVCMGRIPERKNQLLCFLPHQAFGIDQFSQVRKFF